ncbi:MAG: hypothetical protein K2Y39_14370 [Candidatus Obscuribacterales bacterium]|nr:hypothetical protein [Candidatus Obscuribacterales bacterium]
MPATKEKPEFSKNLNAAGTDPQLRFLALYPNRERCIVKQKDFDWKTRNRRLSDAEILKAIDAADDSYKGCRWAEQTKFAVFDVDKAGQYHNEIGLARLRHTLASVGFTSPLLYRSSHSGGWHIYLPFCHAVDSAPLNMELKAWLKKEGFQIKNGQLEIFPSKNGLRLPLQKGFAWLDDQGAVKYHRAELTTEQAIATFLDDLDSHAHDWNLVRQKIAARVKELDAQQANAATANPDEDGFAALFSNAGMIEQVWEAGREYWANGLTAFGQRHHAQLCIGHYLWYGDATMGVRALPGIARADQRASEIESWLKEKHNGYSKSVTQGNWHEITQDIRSACHWQASDSPAVVREPYALSERAIDRLVVLTKSTGRVWYPTFFEKGNVGREEAARTKIRAALIQLLESRRQVTVRGLARLSGCRKQTINRHIDIWGMFKLSNGPGDLRLPLAPSEVLSRPLVLSVEEEGEVAQFFDSVLCSDEALLEPVVTAVDVLEEAFVESVFVPDLEHLSSQAMQDSFDWESAVLKHLPKSLELSDSLSLQFLETLCFTALERTWDVAAQRRLRVVLFKVKEELDRRWLVSDYCSDILELRNESLLLDSG